MIRYECDRCGDTDQLHTREVTIEMVSDHAAMSQFDAPRTLHLCGLCTSIVKGLIEGTVRVELADVECRVSAGVEQVVHAWTVEGPSPTYHRDAISRLRLDWPTLANALDALQAETRR